MTRDEIIAATIEREGGATLHRVAGDPGGLTKYGIAQRFHPEVSVATLTLEDAIDIYAQEYWEPIRGDDLLRIDGSVAEVVFDAAVNLGVARASRIAQLSSQTKPVDGHIGDRTLEQVSMTDPELFVLRFTLARIAYYTSRVEQDRGKRKFFLGWVRRTLDVAA